MQRCKYWGYYDAYYRVSKMSETRLTAIDGVRCSSIQEYPDELSADDIAPLIRQVFRKEHPDFNDVGSALEFLD